MMMAMVTTTTTTTMIMTMMMAMTTMAMTTTTMIAANATYEQDASTHVFHAVRNARCKKERKKCLAFAVPDKKEKREGAKEGKKKIVSVRECVG